MDHRHFEDAVDAVLSLRTAGAFVCALETTEGASSLFDVAFPLPPPLGGESTRSDGADGGVELRRSAGGRVSVVGQASEDSEGQVDRRLLEGAEAFELTGSGVVALVLGNEVTGVDERVLTRCDLVIEVGGLNITALNCGAQLARKKEKKLHGPSCLGPLIEIRVQRRVGLVAAYQLQ